MHRVQPGATPNLFGSGGQARCFFGGDGLGDRGEDRPQLIEQRDGDAHGPEGAVGLGVGVGDLSRAENPVSLLARHAAFPTAASTTSSWSPTSRAALRAT